MWAAICIFQSIFTCKNLFDVQIAQFLCWRKIRYYQVLEDAEVRRTGLERAGEQAPAISQMQMEAASSLSPPGSAHERTD